MKNIKKFISWCVHTSKKSIRAFFTAKNILFYAEQGTLRIRIIFRQSRFLKRCECGSWYRYLSILLFYAQIFVWLYKKNVSTKLQWRSWRKNLKEIIPYTCDLKKQNADKEKNTGSEKNTAYSTSLYYSTNRSELWLKEGKAGQMGVKSTRILTWSRSSAGNCSVGGWMDRVSFSPSSIN